MSTERKDSTESNNTSNQYLIERYFGEGALLSEDGKKLRCRFEAGQLEDGLNYLICNCLISEMNLNDYFPNINFENCPPPFIKSYIGMNLWTEHGQFFFLRFKSFEGVTFDDFKITGNLGGYFSVYDDSLLDNTQQVKVAYYIEELSIKANVKGNLQFLTFGVTNFEFYGNESHGDVLSLDIKGVKSLIIMKKGERQDEQHFWERFKGIRVTCEVIVEIEEETKIVEVIDMVYDLCDLMSIASGSRIQWIYCYGFDTEGKILLRIHRSSITRPYQPMQLIRNNYLWMKKFLEDSYVVFTENQNLLSQNRYIINIYLESKAENDLVEQRGIKLVIAIETFKELYLNINPEREYIINENKFEKMKPDLQDELKIFFKQSIDSKSRGLIYKNISGLNRTPFQDILSDFCEFIGLEVNDLQSIVASRNSLVHTGKFFCQLSRDKKKNIKKYPQFQNPYGEYSYVMNFADKCILKMLRYKGNYINQFKLEEEELL